MKLGQELDFRENKILKHPLFWVVSTCYDSQNTILKKKSYVRISGFLDIFNTITLLTDALVHGLRISTFRVIVLKLRVNKVIGLVINMINV